MGRLKSKQRCNSQMFLWKEIRSRMLTTYKNWEHDELTKDNKHGGEEFGWHGIWRRILKDTLYFNGKSIQNDTVIKEIDKKCDERFKDKQQLEIADSDLYK